MDLKIVFILILGIVTSTLIYKIVHNKVYGVEGGLFDPIFKPINKIINGVNLILCFIIYLIDLFVWCAKTMASIMSLFVPPCPFFYIIDMFIAFVGFILGSLLRLLRLDMLIDAFSLGCDGINFITKTALGIEIFDFHEWMGIKPLCYNPNFAFKPFPEFVPPKRRDYI